MASNTVIRTNVLALNSHRNLGLVGTQKERSSQRLSSGYRINSAADDAAGLAISEKMRAQIRGLDMANKNTQDAISLIQTAEGGLQEIDNMIQRIRELVVYAANDTQDYNNAGETSGKMTVATAMGDRQKIQDEINMLMQEIDSMASRVEFNKKKLIDGSFDKTAKAQTGGATGTTLWFQTGANAGQGLELNISMITCHSLGLASGGNGVNNLHTLALPTTVNGGSLSGSLLNLLQPSGNTGGVGAANANLISAKLKIIDAALTIVTTERAKLGAAQNRLEYTSNSLQISSENLSSSESRVRNADMGKEMMSLTQANILQQAAISMLAQGNQQPQSILQLLQ